MSEWQWTMENWQWATITAAENAEVMQTIRCSLSPVEGGLK